MAISTYTELKAALIEWSHKGNIDSLTGDFIALAERRIKSEFSINDEEIETPLTATIGSATISLPSNYKSAIALYITDLSPREKLTQVMPEQLERTTDNARPVNWAIDGVSIRFDCPADQAYTFSLRYLKSWELSDSNDTNAVLTKWPDVYLAAGLIEVYSHAWDTENEAKWISKFNEAVTRAKVTEADSHKYVPLMFELSGQSFDINRGY